MANHGYCRNCWWCGKFENEKYVVNGISIKRVFMNGKCYMQKGDDGECKSVSLDSYCRDYINRKKEEKKSGTLDQWLSSKNLEK